MGTVALVGAKGAGSAPRGHRCPREEAWCRCPGWGVDGVGVRLDPRGTELGPAPPPSTPYPRRHQVLRIVPTNAEELQKVQELQALEELQVPGGFWGTAPPCHLLCTPQTTL